MNIKKNLLFATVLACGVIFVAKQVTANMVTDDDATTSDHADKSIKSAKSSRQRVAANQELRNHNFSNFGQDYTDFKNYLNKKYNFDYAIDVSYMGQRGAPAGEKSAFQTIISPSFTWKTFQNQYGTGTLSAAYNIVRYGGSQAERIGNNIGVATAINDFDSKSTAFDELLYSYELGGSWDWLTIAAGQFPIYNFDGSAYDSNQQVNFVNYALSQNATSTYATAGLGTYVQVAPDSNWTIIAGLQDATDIDGESIRFNGLDESHYTTFGSVSYTPNIKGLGTGQYSVLLYNQPGVTEQPQTTNGWSLNMSQDLGEKWAVFGRVNGVSGDVADFKNSYVIGAVYNDPLDRNPLDQIGLAAALNKVNKKALGDQQARSEETVLEAYWAWGVSKWMTLTPDIQLYVKPALNQKSDYASVYTLRATLFF